MFFLRLIVRVREDKRRELIQALNSFVVEGTGRPCRRLVLEDESDDGLICWMGDWSAREQLDAFIACPTYRAMCGAASVLGSVEGEQIIHGEEVSLRSGGEQ